MPFFDPQFLPLAQQAESGGYREWIDSLARTPLSQVVTFVGVLTVVRLLIFPILTKTAVHRRGFGHGAVRTLNEILDAFVYAGVFVFLLIRPFLLQAFLIPSGSMWPTLDINDFIVANKAVYRYSEPVRGDIVVFRPPVEAVLDPSQKDKDGEVKVDFIKRLVGVPGDVVELREGKRYLNGKPDPEPYIHYSNQSHSGQFTLMSEDEIAQMTHASFKLVKWQGKLIPLNYTDEDANSPMPRGSFGERPYVVAPEFTIPDPDDQRRARSLPAEPVPPGYLLMMGDNRNGSFDGRGWGLVKRESVVGRSEIIWLPFSRWGMTR